MALSDLEILNEMIKDSSKAAIEEDQYKNRFVTLCEPQIPTCRFKIKRLPPEAVVIKVDDFKSPDMIFTGNKNECRRADYAIVGNTTKGLVIIYIEMKKTKGSQKEIIDQLKGAECFIAYCREIGKTFWEKKDFLAGCQRRFISIAHIPIAKRTTRPPKFESPMRQKHDTPEKMMKITWANKIYFDKLASA